MSKLTKAQAKAHAKACNLLKQDVLSYDDKMFVLENWQESATHINGIAGAFFTPVDLASSMSIEIPERSTIIDLCAGIGALSFFALDWRKATRIVCVELNPDYIEVGRKIVPEAEWIRADFLALPSLGHFDCAIGNPPFGSVKRSGAAPRYSGSAFEYHVIDVASDLADYGVFIIPQNSAPFRYSGEPTFTKREEDGYRKFAQQTGITLLSNCGIDTSFASGDWHGVSPKVEIVLADFAEDRRKRDAGKSGPLFSFAEAAE